MNSRAMIYRARNALRRRGLEVGRTNPDCPPYAFLQLGVFPVLGINCVIDVGAGRGEFGGHLRDFGYVGRIVSFEPASGNYKFLRDKAKSDPGWFTHHCALGHSDETGELHVTRGPFWNSMLMPSQYGMQEFGSELEIVGTEQVDIRRLDSVFDECVQGLTLPRVYLKLDTQGFDRHVLSGAVDALPRIPALQTEISFCQEYEGMDSAEAMFRETDALGYSLSGIYKVFRDRHLALVEADGVFVRPDAVAL